MKLLEIITIFFAIISAGCLASIQIRKIVKGELSMFGLKAFTASFEINLDNFDKRMILIAGISFVLSVILFLTTYI